MAVTEVIKMASIVGDTQESGEHLVFSSHGENLGTGGGDII